MRWNGSMLWAMVGALALGLCGLQAGEEGEGKDAPKQDAPKEEQKKDGDRPRPEGARDGPRGGDRRGRGPGGFGDLLGRGRNSFDSMIYRMMGYDEPAKVEDLAYGAEKRFVLDVPVGGVDSLADRSNGWKAEDIFTMTPEQAKSLETLRAEYSAELKDMQKRLEEANAAIAAQVKDLRLKYEKRANDVLTGESKTQKEQLDALASEFHQKSYTEGQDKRARTDELVGEVNAKMAEARENGNWEIMREVTGKGMQFAREFREATDKVLREAIAKMQEVPTGEAKGRLEVEFRKVLERLDQQNQVLQGRGGGDRPQGDRPPGPQGRRPGGDRPKPDGEGAEAQKPQAPPDDF